MLGLEDIKETKLGKELLAEGWQKGRQEGWQEGRQEGRQEGEQLGRLKGKLEVVPVMLNRGFTFEEVALLFEIRVEPGSAGNSTRKTIRVPLRRSPHSVRPRNRVYTRYWARKTEIKHQ
ncbi:MAG: Rpn family recombination-promoting nuclease/putative transposase [Hormoscilla sp. SP5CHS1]|nr:Rpn family recombination-promoting nuclease/putative transposase [Hormoscilla sp. SP12CHS1]MBC6453961.1 Rpn family recombination-promoting nuclease/putative transposase [Hormoscilla sp. SP5CHS1]